MANILTNPGVLFLDTVGIIKMGPVYIKALEFIPYAASDGFTLSAYDLSTKLSIGKAVSGTITLTHTLTNNDGGAALPAAFAAGDIFDIFESSGAAANKGKQLITTGGNNTVVVCSQAGWTNEALKTYDFCRYAQYLAYQIKSVGGTYIKSEGRTFGDPGLRFESLALTAISANAKLVIYT